VGAVRRPGDIGETERVSLQVADEFTGMRRPDFDDFVVSFALNG
jgi:hypothetical protein